MKKRVIFYVPARRSSVRLKDKNLKCILGETLVALSVDFAYSISNILRDEGIESEVWLDTDYDAEEVKIPCNVAYHHYNRKPEFAKDGTTTYETFNDFWETVKFQPNDIFVLLQPTSPLRSQKTVYDAIKYNIEENMPLRSAQLVKNQCIAVSKTEDGYDSIQYDKGTIMTEDGNFFVFRMVDIAKRKKISGNVDLQPVWNNSPYNDIDTELDFQKTKFIMEHPEILENFYKENLL